MPTIAHCMLAGALLAATATANATPQGLPTISDLGALGAKGSYVTAVNNRGDIVGYSTKMLPGSTTETFRATLWENGVLRDLGAPVADHSQAMSVNDRGTIAVNADGNRTYLYKDGAWVNLNVYGTPYDINRLDAVTGVASVGARRHAFLWQDGILRDLGTLGGSMSAGVAINNRGVVAGFSTLQGDAVVRAFIYEGGRMTNLGSLGARDCYASDINDHGVVVGACDVDGRDSVPFIWDGGMMRQLLEHPGNYYATAINNAGDIVGGSDWGGFLYRNGNVTRLELIPTVRAAGWYRLHPTDINELGWIVGYGYRTGESGPRGFLLKLESGGASPASRSPRSIGNVSVRGPT